MKKIQLYFLFLSFTLIINSSFAGTDNAEILDKLFSESKNFSEQAQATDNFNEKSVFAQKGFLSAEKCLGLDSKNLGCLFYRAVNRGINLETRTAKIKEGLRLMIADFKNVIGIDDRYENGGAYRALGTLYLKAPVLPILGNDLKRDLDLAANYAKKALSIAPNDSENLQLAGLIALKRNNNEEAYNYFRLAFTNLHKSKLPPTQKNKLKNDLKTAMKKAK